MPGSAVLPDYPGGTFDVGHRDIDPIDPGINQIHNGGADSNPDITVMTYSFALDRSYGVDSLGRPLFTSITSDQMARVREVFDFYSAQLELISSKQLVLLRSPWSSAIWPRTDSKAVQAAPWVLQAVAWRSWTSRSLG